MYYSILSRLGFTRILAVSAVLLASFSARAGLTVNIHIYRQYPFGYTCYPELAMNAIGPAAPLGGYVITSPGVPGNGWGKLYQLDGSGLSDLGVAVSHLYSDFNTVLQQITNGAWSIVVTNGTVTNTYHFKVSASGLDANSLPYGIITYPADGATGVPNNPTFTWTGPTSWTGNLVVEDYSSDFSFFQFNSISPSLTNYQFGPTFPDGMHTFYLDYSRDASANLVASTPTNNSAQAISGWVSSGTLDTFMFSSFTVSPSATLSLGTVLNATNLTWTTSGNANWFGESTDSHDGISAAQSGAIGSGGYSVLQTTVTGPGTLTFWWQSYAPGNASMDIEFDLDGDDVDDIYDVQSWVQEPTVTIPTGTHTISWTAYSSGPGATEAAGWVDQVQFIPQLPTVTASLGFQIRRSQYLDNGDSFTVLPYIISASPNTYGADEVDSPTGLFSSAVSYGETSLDALINECTNGDWTLYIDKGHLSERRFYFKASISGLTSNLLQTVTVTVPTNGAVNVSVNTPFQWSGPSGYSSLYIYNYLVVSGVDMTQDQTYLPVTATNWDSPPAQTPGTNGFLVNYFLNNPGVMTFSTPTDDFLNTVSDWSTSVSLETDTTVQFIVSDNSSASPVQLSAPQSAGGNFSLSFQTQSGHAHTIQTCPNLAMGQWVDLTNFMGDGSMKQFTFPETNAFGGYYRVKTQ